MFGFAARLLGGAVSPLVDRATVFGVSILRRVALLAIAAICMVVVLIALTIAFDLWIDSLAGPIVGALAVAGVYFVVAVAALLLALRRDRPKATSQAEQTSTKNSERSEKVDQFTSPILAILQSLGLRREQFAVLAGASLAKQLKPLPLVGVAIVAGFLLGRLWRGWGALLGGQSIDRLLDLVLPARREHPSPPEPSSTSGA